LKQWSRVGVSIAAALLASLFPSIGRSQNLSTLVPKIRARSSPGEGGDYDKAPAARALIHGENDLITPPSIGEAFVAAMNDHCASVTLWVAEGAQHNLAFSASPKLYGERVVQFLKSAVGATQIAS